MYCCRPPAAGQSHWYLTLIKAPPPPTPPQTHTPHTQWPSVSPPTQCSPCLLHPHADSCERSMVSRKRQRSHFDASKTRPSPFLTHDEVLRWGSYLYTPSKRLRLTQDPSDPWLRCPKHRFTLENVGFRFGVVGRCDVGQHSRCLAVVSVSPQTGCSAFYPAGSRNLFSGR